MMQAAFPVATAATDLTGTSSRATSLQANEYTLMDSAHSSNKCENFGFFFPCILTTKRHIYGVCPRGRQDAATQSARKQAHTHTHTH